MEKAKDETARDDARLKRLKDEIARIADGDDKAMKEECSASFMPSFGGRAWLMRSENGST